MQWALQKCPEKSSAGVRVWEEGGKQPTEAPPLLAVAAAGLDLDGARRVKGEGVHVLDHLVRQLVAHVVGREHAALEKVPE